MASPLQLFERFEVGIERNRQVNYANVASVTIIVLDWLLTLDMEVSLVWPAQWNVTKILYFLTRYLPFIDTSVVMYRQFGTVLSPSLCRITYQYAAWTFIVGMGCAELILVLRTYAVWNRDTRLKFGLPILFVVTLSVGFIVIGIYLNKITHAVSPVPRLLGCFFPNDSTILSGCYITLMIFDACILSLMMIRGISAYRSGGDSQFLRVVYSDGIIYYVYLTALSIFNVVIILHLPSDYINLMVMMERVIHSVLACRVILHIRELGQNQQRNREKALSQESQTSNF